MQKIAQLINQITPSGGLPGSKQAQIGLLLALVVLWLVLTPVLVLGFHYALEEVSGETTILLVEHDIEAVIEYTERVLCLNRELYFDGPSEDFLDSNALEQAYGITTDSEAGGER